MVLAKNAVLPVLLTLAVAASGCASGWVKKTTMDLMRAADNCKTKECFERMLGEPDERKALKEGKEELTWSARSGKTFKPMPPYDVTHQYCNLSVRCDEFGEVLRWYYSGYACPR